MGKPWLDPMLALSLSLGANKGVYALLIASGVSRAARIPTGWEITLDLIRKLAASQKADCRDDPAAWYRTTYSREPDYSDLLDAIAKSPEERHQILRAYIEPTADERVDGWKQPTNGHKAIARLVAQGCVRVILTTNFDRLTELAIEDVGITPTVISTAGAVAGALPLIHQRCTVVKLHGDYLDTRIKNTPNELAAYDDAVNQLLDRILDEFGLIVCGWSGVWDTALRDAIERCPTRRFSTYWASVSAPASGVQGLLQRRDAQVITIKDADSFFTELADKVEALDASSQPHPLSIVAAVASLKKYVAEDRFNIQLHDLLAQEGERVFQEMAAFETQLLAKGITEKGIPEYFRTYREMLAMLVQLMMHGCYWSRPGSDDSFVSVLQRISRRPKLVSGQTLHTGVHHYPIIYSLYAGGLAAVATGNYNLLRKLFLKPTISDYQKSRSLVVGIDWAKVIEFSATVHGNNKKHTPLSEHLYGLMRTVLASYIPDDEQFDAVFDRYEYIQALVYADLHDKEYPGIYRWGPMGRFAWKAHHGLEHSILKTVEREAGAQGVQWPPIAVGLFDGSLDRLKVTKENLDALICRLQYF